MKRILLICFSLSMLWTYAQDSTATAPPKSSEDITYDYDKHAVGLYLGAKGIGLEYGYAFDERWSFRAAVGGLYWTPLEFSRSFSGDEYTVEVTPEYLLVDVGAEYYPWAGKSFKVFGALGYAFYQNVSMYAAYDGAITVGEMATFTGEEVGSLTFNGTTNKLVPSAGFGWGHTVPKKTVGLYCELGTYYMGAPKIEIEATNMLSETKQEEEQLNENFSQYRWLPFINVGIRFKL